MFALGIEFITGVAVMTDAASREQAEWPPHPARVFMAMVAAHWESSPLPADGHQVQAAWTAERTALEWLETQGAPEMSWPDASPRNVVKCYVPVNDVGVSPNPLSVKEEKIRDSLSVMPDRRTRQERTFPALHVGGIGPERHVYLHWPQASPRPEILLSLKLLARKVSRIGHSSSLTVVWVGEPENIPTPTYSPSAVTTTARQGKRLRIPAPGFLAELDRCYNAADIDDYFDLTETILRGTAAAKTQAKSNFKNRFGDSWSRSTIPPVRLRPTIGRTACYSRIKEPAEQIAPSGFDHELLVLSKQEGPVLGLEATATLTAALRGYLLQGGDAKPEWFTGHRAQGLPATDRHMALLPLSFVGVDHADGHVMGLAVAFPSGIPHAERASCLRGLLFGPSGEDLEPELRMGRLGTWTLRREDRGLPPMALRSTTWCDPSSVWASVTPVVLDRHPKHNPRTEQASWRKEVVTSIAQSCQRLGLPTPDLIDVDQTSWHQGAPRSTPGSDGMPWLPTKQGSSPRMQVHVLIKFSSKVRGPLLLGAGRYRGYGLCKPLGYPPQ